VVPGQEAGGQLRLQPCAEVLGPGQAHPGQQEAADGEVREGGPVQVLGQRLPRQARLGHQQQQRPEVQQAAAKLRLTSHQPAVGQGPQQPLLLRQPEDHHVLLQAVPGTGRG